MEWPDIFFEPVNLPLIGSDPALIHESDCEKCKYYNNYLGDDHCGLFYSYPGPRCSQFKEKK